MRSRLYFQRIKTEKDTDPNQDLRKLEVMKSNYRPAGETINMTWSKGLFVPVASLSHVEKASAEQKAEQVFLELLNQFNGDRNNVSAKDTARNYAATKFANEPKAKEANVKKDDFKKAMRRLLDAGKIKVEDYGSPAHGKSRLVTP